MTSEKEHQEICVVGRLFSLEALLAIMGAASLIYGLVTGRLASVGLGVIVLGLGFLLIRLCRRGQKNL
jgi:hypothetical protein